MSRTGRIKHSYGSTDVVPATHHDTEALIGEELVATDNEEESPTDTAKFSHDENSRLLDRQRSPWSCCHCIGDCVLNLQGNHPVGHVTRIVLVMGMAICMCTLALVLSPPKSQGTSQGGSNSGNINTDMPFQRVDRASYSQPASSIVNTDLFHPSLLFNETTRASGGDKSVDPLLNDPFPTGAFWTNLVLETTGDRGLSYPVVSYPYAFKWSDTGLQASYPPLRRKVGSTSIRDQFLHDMTFSSSEQVTQRYVMKFDPLSVTTRFQTDGGGYWESYLVQGSPYITVKYEKTTPVLTALSTFKNVVCPFDADGKYNDGSAQGTQDKDSSELKQVKGGVCSSSTKTDDSSVNLTTLRGVQFLLQTQEDLTWMIFSSEPITLTFDTIRKTTATVSDTFSGVLRLALIPPTPGDTDGSAPLSTSTGLKRLVYHAGVYPVSGSVSWDFRTGQVKQSLAQTTQAAVAANVKGNNILRVPPDRVATIHFQFNTKSMNSDSADNSQEELLMLSLPHHAESLRSDVQLELDQFDLVYMSIKGHMTPVLGNTWSYEEPMKSFGFDDMDATTIEKYVKDVKPQVQSVIMENVKEDIKSVLPTLDENIYGFGKQVARLAQLAHIANSMAPITTRPRLIQNEADPMRELTENAARSLHSILVSFLQGGVIDTLLYDGNFGGIVTKAGLLNSEADFGNGWFNDHHFHYGYVLYACAIMGSINRTFVDEYAPYVDALLFDVAHDSTIDSKSSVEAMFPLARHKSWFDGHSFASGLFPFANGKSQESSSEAVNCYYGAYLWSLVRFGTSDDVGLARTDFARLLLATEIRGAKKYWHMLPPGESLKAAANRLIPQVYDPIFAKNYMVGNLGMLDAVCSTWFGTQSLYVHMINFMPVTAITSQLFEKKYVQEEFKNVLEPLLPNVEMAWKGFVVCDHAIVNASVAWNEAQDLVSHELDASLSKSQVLYWISTRGGFVAPTLPAPAPGPPENNTTVNGETSSSSCERNAACANLGLTGLCCPTSEGVTLGCCDQQR